MSGTYVYTFTPMSLVTAFLAGVALAPPAPRHISYEPVRRGRTTYHVVKANLASGFVDARTLFTNGLRSPKSLLAGASPTAGITGTFFAPGFGTPVADVMVDGELVARGNRGSGIAFSDDGQALIFDRPFRRRFDWGEYKWGLRGAVRLIKDGKVCPNPKAQSFRDPRIWGRAARTGVGITEAGKLLLVATKSKVTLSEFGRAIKSKGAVDAVSLDGGSSTCLYYRGSMLVSSARRLSNMLVLQERPATY